MCQNDYLDESVNNLYFWISKISDMDWYTFSPTVTWDTWVQLILLLSGIFLVWRQLQSQRKLQIKQHKNTIQYNVYEKLVENYENSQPTAMSRKLNIIMNEFDKAIERSGEGREYIAPPFYLNDIHHEYMELHSNLLRIMATMDKYQIISPYMSLFKKVLSLKITELGNHFVTLIFVFAYILLPEKGGSAPLHVPSEETINKVKDKLLQFDDTSWDIAYYLDDILTEAQNTLLGDFFSHSLPVRKPENPEELVLTSTNQKMIDIAQKLLKDTDNHSRGHVLT